MICTLRDERVPALAAKLGTTRSAAAMELSSEKLAGAEVYRYLMRRIWWATPLYFLSTLPILRDLFNAGYRAFADNRYWISRSCHLPARRDENYTLRKDPSRRSG